MSKRWHAFEFMTRHPYCVKQDTPLSEVTREMVERRITGAPVLGEHEELVGIVTFADIAVHTLRTPAGTVRDVMQRRVYTVDQAATLTTVVSELQSHRVHRLVVTDHGRVVGIISALDLLGAILERTGYPMGVL